MTDHTTNEFYESMKEYISEIASHLENISDGINHKPQDVFCNRVAHALTCDLFDGDKLNLVRIFYQMMAWPEKELSEGQKELFQRLYPTK